MKGENVSREKKMGKKKKMEDPSTTYKTPEPRSRELEQNGTWRLPKTEKASKLLLKSSSW